MKPIFWTILFVLMAGSAIWAQGADSTRTDLENLHKSIAQFYEGVASKNADMVLEIFADSAMMMPNGGNIVKGKAAITEVWKRGVAAGFSLKDIETIDLQVSGDIAYKVAQYYFGNVVEGQETTWYPTKNIHIFRRQADGNWKLMVDIWNSSPEKK